MKTETENSALIYCKNIAKELDALENILSAETVRTDDDNELLTEAFAELEFENTGEPMDAISQWLNETILDFTILRTDDKQITRIEILRTCGGPHCEISRANNDSDIIEVTTHDGTEQATIRNTYPMLANYLDECAQ